MFHHKCTIRMLSLRRPCLLASSCVDFIKTMQDPRHLFKVNNQNLRWSRLSFMCLLLFSPCVRHLWNLVAVKHNIFLSINAKVKRNSATAAYHWTEESRTNTVVQNLSKTDHNSGNDFLVYFPSFFCWKYPQIGDTFIIWRTAKHLVSVRLFTCSESVSRIDRFIQCYLCTYSVYRYIRHQLLGTIGH